MLDQNAAHLDRLRHIRNRRQLASEPTTEDRGREGRENLPDAIVLEDLEGVSEGLHELRGDGTQEADDLIVVVGKPPERLLAEDEVAVSDDLVDAAGALDELGNDTESVLDCGGQTVRAGLVVSLYAVLDRDLHEEILLGEESRTASGDYSNTRAKRNAVAARVNGRGRGG